ncbi:helix-turn-helix domain-containing protein [Marininema halotolerans]|uniref:Helix-turn-helix domain-containing protein n=1 Tax=Marininema halotolerans TaxID=1155944 RepID=A0A1I6R5Y1_9BACL|nr:helix-turn-helix transcriptional regulator [Marininema halotolerans]SFS60107.1 Helix-turn-helix domain-containing protein [Marininema halotolerans]
MPRPTDQLRLRREQAGLTLEDIQRQTRIRLEYLRGIETGDYSLLPGKFAVRRTVEAYCNVLGLDSARMMRQIEGSHSSSIESSYSVPAPVDKTPDPSAKLPSRSRSRKERTETRAENETSRIRGRQKEQRGRRRRKKSAVGEFLEMIQAPLKKGIPLNLVIILVGVLLLGLGTVWVVKEFIGEETATQKQKTSSEKNSSHSSPIQGDSSVVELIKPSETYKYGDLFKVSKADEIMVTLQVEKETSFIYRKGGPTEKIAEKGKIKAGEKKSFHHDKWISLEVGTPSHVKLIVNGHEIDTSHDAKDHHYQIQRKP